MIIRLVYAALFLGATALGASGVDINATARFLAGLPVRGTELEPLSYDAAWTEHATEFDRAWAKIEELQLSKIRQWGPAYLGPASESQGPMFYFFSGPDFLYAHSFFPNARTYILCGIEPVGVVPDIAAIPPPALRASLGTLRKSLDSLLNWSFFITKNMKVDLTQTQLGGITPVLCVFLARTGCEIQSVESVALDRSGSFAGTGKGTAPGVRIVFASNDGRQHTLYYFSSDLSDGGVGANPGFLKFCGQQGRGVALLKAASYLLHGNGFNRARDFLLTNSNCILQDDSGIPYRFLANDRWKVRFCGKYVGPIELFKEHPQPDLAKAFASTVPVPLGFGFGYQWRPSVSSVIIAVPRSGSD